jgi:hypothetical protein
MRNVQPYELRVKRVDVKFDERLKKSFEAALAKGLWKGAAAVLTLHQRPPRKE